MDSILSFGGIVLLKELFLAPLGLFTNERGSVNVEFQP
jgi:hypothetical protein